MYSCFDINKLVGGQGMESGCSVWPLLGFILINLGSQAELDWEARQRARREGKVTHPHPVMALRCPQISTLTEELAGKRDPLGDVALSRSVSPAAMKEDRALSVCCWRGGSLTLFFISEKMDSRKCLLKSLPTLLA